METLEAVQHPCKFIVMDPGLDVCDIFTTMNKDQYTNFVFLCLIEKNLQLKSKFFAGKHCARHEVFYLNIDPSEAMKCVAFHNHSGEDQISHGYYVKLLGQKYQQVSKQCMFRS